MVGLCCVCIHAIKFGRVASDPDTFSGSRPRCSDMHGLFGSSDRRRNLDCNHGPLSPVAPALLAIRTLPRPCGGRPQTRAAMVDSPAKRTFMRRLCVCGPLDRHPRSPGDGRVDRLRGAGDSVDYTRSVGTKALRRPLPIRSTQHDGRHRWRPCRWRRVVGHHVGAD